MKSSSAWRSGIRRAPSSGTGKASPGRGTRSAAASGSSRRSSGIPDLCGTVIRHVYTTEALQKGVNPVALAELLGHRDVTTLSKNYAHLFRNPEFLLQQAEKATT